MNVFELHGLISDSKVSKPFIIGWTNTIREKTKQENQENTQTTEQTCCYCCCCFVVNSIM